MGRRPGTLTDGETEHLEFQVSLRLISVGHPPSLEPGPFGPRWKEGQRKQACQSQGCGRKSLFAPLQQQRLFTSKPVFFKEADTRRGKTPF